MKGLWSIFAKITIPVVIIYVVILLVANTCSSCAPKGANSNRNCSSPADVVPPSNGGQEEPAKAPQWNNVHNAKDFWTAVHSQPKNIVLFGTEYCSWCRATEKWWSENSAVNGWQFIDWNYMDKDGEIAYDEFLKTLTDIYFTRNPADAPIGFPTCAVLVNAQPGKPLTESVIYTGYGFYECSNILKDFVLSIK